MSHTLYIDLETRSKLDLRKVGVYVYAAHASTHVHCVAWALDDGEVYVWKQGDDLIGAGNSSNWLDLIRLPNVTLVAHNVEFEKQILEWEFELPTPIEKWSDTAARCARLSLPRSLEEAAEHLRLQEQKDVSGSRVMLKLAKARRPSKENRDEFWNAATKPEDFETLYAYCAQDVSTMRAIDRVVPNLVGEELDVWRMTIEMNERGMSVDTAAVPIAIGTAARATRKLAAEFESLVGVKPTSSKAAEALGLASLDKAHVRDALKTFKEGHPLHRPLTLRKLVARSSVKKLHAFEHRTSTDGRIRGMLTYAGAERTLRWSGGGVQPQNFPRGMGKDLIQAFELLHLDLFEETYPDVLKALADILRGFFTGPLLVGDFAQIEARVLAWLAGQQDLIKTFATGGDPYCEMASAIFGRPITKKSTDSSLAEGVTPRFIGKTVVLGAGYGLGGQKFMEQVDKQYDVQIDEDFAKRCINTFRRRYTMIPKLWEKLDNGFIYIVRNNSTRVKVGPVFMGNVFFGEHRFAYVELPNGRKMYYAHPAVTESGRVEYLGRNLYKGGAWERVTGYGGKWAENITQAFSRDLLARAMLRLRAHSFHLSNTIHDEVVAADPADRLAEFERILSEVPDYAPGLPIGVECFACERYHK